MRRSEIAELHYITLIENVPSMIERGILSHRRAKRVLHHSVAMEEIQERRRNKQIPGARPLHEYANLYFDAHNPMLSKCRGRNDEICVLQVSPDILDLPGVIVTDMNAARVAVRFYDAATGLAALDRDRLYAVFWLHPDNLIEQDRHRALKCAEVLVPDCVTPEFIQGVYVANQSARDRADLLSLALPVTIKSGMFFS
jgi:ssDNA thymidine ADP-ribosyltransferase, DarT